MKKTWLLLLVPATMLFVSTTVYLEAHSQRDQIIRDWQAGLREKAESLRHIIGSRSGENSAVAARGGNTFGPVFEHEEKELIAVTEQLARGPALFDTHPVSLQEIANTENLSLDWMIAACVFTAFCLYFIIPFKKQERRMDWESPIQYPGPQRLVIETQQQPINAKKDSASSDTATKDTPKQREINEVFHQFSTGLIDEVQRDARLKRINKILGSDKG